MAFLLTKIKKKENCNPLIIWSLLQNQMIFRWAGTYAQVFTYSHVAYLFLTLSLRHEHTFMPFAKHWLPPTDKCIHSKDSCIYKSYISCCWHRYTFSILWNYLVFMLPVSWHIVQLPNQCRTFYIPVMGK